MVFVVGVAAALSLGLGYVLQQRVAATAPLTELLSFRLLFDLMHRRMWWAGIGAMVLGQLLAGLALHMASVALVEPLLSANLLFALAIAATMSGQRIRWYEIVGALLLSASLGVFIAVGDPRSSATPAPNNAVIILALCSVIGAVAVLVIIGKGQRHLVTESVLLATGAGLLYGLQDAATRSALLVADHHGITSIFLNPWVYIIVGAAVIGILLSQSAFKAARLDYSLPPIAAAEPVAGILLGVTVLGDVISLTFVGVIVEFACLLAMVAGVVLIGRGPSLAGHHPHLHRRSHPVSPAHATRADPP